MLGTMLKVALLLINSIAVLNEERFLARIGWLSSSQQPRDAHHVYPGYDQTGYGAVQQDAGIKARLVDLISAVRTLMRIPLIVINIIVIVYELLLGG
ncbi:ER-to-golgi transport membrane protein [Amanita muscaria]|uniref:Yos1-like protein n=1 Tax=Amanita muscaria (strain Koide BX008) TaxID=946122 RepID=A0A0C2TS16_AMAMK|nr:hypothetical protein M378DRAFT_96278 [Amanita muscaria Koide BX008]